MEASPRSISSCSPRSSSDTPSSSSSTLHINKGAAALLLAGALWSLYFTGAAPSLHEATHNSSYLSR